MKGKDKYTSDHLKKSSININTFENEELIKAIEVKRFRSKQRYSYYKGLDQAIAYLKFGFDLVALWHIYDKELIEKNIEYAYKTWQFIKELNMPLNFTTLILESENLYPVNIINLNYWVYICTEYQMF